MSTQSTSTPVPTAQPASVRFGGLERRTLLLGFSPSQTSLLAVATAIVIIAVYTTGLAGVVVTGPVWGPLIVVATAQWAGRPLTAWIPITTQWLVRRVLHLTTSISRPTVTRAGPHPVTTSLALPGIRGRLVVLSLPDGAAVVIDRRLGLASLTLVIESNGFVLDAASAQDQKVNGWGRVLASLTQQPGVVRVQLESRRVPGGGAPVRTWWTQVSSTERSWAGDVVAELLEGVAASAKQSQTLMTVALRLPRRATRMSEENLEQLLTQAKGLRDSLAVAELGSRVIDRAELMSAMRYAYDPMATARALAPHGQLLPPPEGVSIGSPAPVGIAESWNHLRTDNAAHVVYWISQWPRSEVHPAFLQPLLLDPNVDRTFTLIAEPLSTAKALKEIRRAKTEHVADAAHRTRTGQIEDESVAAARAELERREQDLVAGHGDLRFTGLLTVTTASPAKLEAACAATETAAAQAMCEIRKLVGQQGLAHVAATLPLARGVL